MTYYTVKQAVPAFLMKLSNTDIDRRPLIWVWAHGLSEAAHFFESFPKIALQKSPQCTYPDLVSHLSLAKFFEHSVSAQIFLLSMKLFLHLFYLSGLQVWVLPFSAEYWIPSINESLVRLQLCILRLDSYFST